MANKTSGATQPSVSSDSEAMAATSGRSVSDTYELLEMILLHLPVMEIFKAKAVSKDWKALIERSKPLKRAMFLLCDPNDCLQSTIHKADRRAMHMLKDTTRVEVVPLFTDVTESAFARFRAGRQHRQGVFHVFKTLDRSLESTYSFLWALGEAMQATSQPWSKLYLTNTAVNALIVTYYGRDEGGSKCATEAKLVDESGIMVGLLAERIVQIAKDAGEAAKEIESWQFEF